MLRKSIKASPLTGSDGVKDTDGKATAKANDIQHKSKSLCSNKSSKVRLWDLWPVNTLLFYSAFATRLILCFLSLHKQHFVFFVTAHSEFITAHFVFHCTLKNALSLT